MTEHALAREAGVRGDLRQGEVAALQEQPGPLDAAHDDELVRRQSGGRLELPREVVGAEAGDRGHLLQGQAGVEVFLDVRDDGPEPPPRERAIPPALRPAGGQDVPDQVDDQDVGQGLGGQPIARGTGCQLDAYCPHCGPKVGEFQAIQWRDDEPSRVEAERLGGDPRHHPRLQEDEERVKTPAITSPGRAAGRYQ